MFPAGVGTRRKMDSAETVLPHPDSPTIPSVLPRATSKETPSTARTLPASVRKVVTRLRTDSSADKSPLDEVYHDPPSRDPEELAARPSAKIDVEPGPGTARNAGCIARTDRRIRRCGERETLIVAAAERP